MADSSGSSAGLGAPPAAARTRICFAGPALGNLIQKIQPPTTWTASRNLRGLACSWRYPLSSFSQWNHWWNRWFSTPNCMLHIMNSTKNFGWLTSQSGSPREAGLSSRNALIGDKNVSQALANRVGFHRVRWSFLWGWARPWFFDRNPRRKLYQEEFRNPLQMDQKTLIDHLYMHQCTSYFPVCLVLSHINYITVCMQYRGDSVLLDSYEITQTCGCSRIAHGPPQWVAAGVKFRIWGMLPLRFLLFLLNGSITMNLNGCETSIFLIVSMERFHNYSCHSDYHWMTRVTKYEILRGWLPYIDLLFNHVGTARFK